MADDKRGKWRNIRRWYIDEHGGKRVELGCGHSLPDDGESTEKRRCIHCYISRVRGLKR